jgi:hypothetical protein
LRNCSWTDSQDTIRAKIFSKSLDGGYQKKQKLNQISKLLKKIEKRLCEMKTSYQGKSDGRNNFLRCIS